MVYHISFNLPASHHMQKVCRFLWIEGGKMHLDAQFLQSGQVYTGQFHQLTLLGNGDDPVYENTGNYRNSASHSNMK